MRVLSLILLLFVVMQSPGSILNKPYLQAVQQTSISVLVECTSTDPVLVDFGLTSGYGDSARTFVTSTTTASPATFVHKIRLIGLLPDTIYHYRARQLGSASADSWFRTLPHAMDSVHFAWMADSRTNSTVFDTVTSLIYARQPALVIVGGDVGTSGAYSAWQSEFFRPKTLQLISSVPFFLSTGNHEGWATNSMAFTDAPLSPSGSQDYYSFDIGPVHILLLDTEVSYAPGSPQYVFAQSDLALPRSGWTIVACHKPAYCSGGHGEDAGMKLITTNLFEPAGVAVVIAGHSHFYQHNLVHNIHHLVVGTSGAPFYVPTTASYTLKSVQDYNYAIIDATLASLKFWIYNTRNALLDSLSLSRNPSGVEEETVMPGTIRLDQNWPNPFNPVTTLGFDLDASAFVSLTVDDLLGRTVAVLVNGVQNAGHTSVRFDASMLPSGVYFCHLRSGGHAETRKLLLLR